MPWNNQSGGKGGGPWGGGDGPWGNGPNRPNNPWGNGPQRGGGQDPQNSPDLEELLRRSQDRLKRVFPGRRGGGGPGGGGGGPSLGGIGARGIALAAIVVAVIYGLTGIYTVRPGEVGVELVLGRHVGNTMPGLNYNVPYPFGEVFTPDVLRIRELVIGTRGNGRGATTDVPAESLMLTGDENIVDIDFKVQWQINRDHPANFLFNIEDPEGTVKQVAESAMREVVGRRNIQPILTQERQQIQLAVQQLMQQTLDEYQAGITITQVQMQKVDPPEQVIDAFRDVQAARADQETAQNRADAYANEVVPEARGEAAQIVEQSQAYRDQVVAEATGQADRFLSVYEEYAKAPEVTRQRIYLETLERVFSKTDKIIIDQGAGSGVVPYLPLDRMNRAPSTTTNSNAQGNR
ncbi:FtsH protease activity modulator HflK [Acuticoccus sp. I52.16.1]|uniref:FtsH protease activity modulator HflK n=1 Tax=Acuticoccus sp. I52.16.1 TaxID=2928472 RepID=UPI001FD204DA|nr:FtsH protease activity modulator HflK [Acuticoccus sp. I52.16.1]UOM34139.1 FtsH protease activity modulator HflK [Acuticoccus sp. I52.16.1]